MRTTTSAALAAAICACVLAGPAPLAFAPDARAAEPRDSREREALRRFQQALRREQQERAALEKALASAKDEAGGAGAERDAAAARARRAETAAAHLARELEALKRALREQSTQRASAETKLAKAQGRIAALEEKMRKSEQQHAATTESRDERDRKLLAELGVRGRSLATCEQKNVELYALGRELMERHRSLTCGDLLLANEPVTQLKRVQIENLLESYRDRLDAERIEPAVPVSGR
ncbi:MAG: hypothetical protein GEV05_09975 [Betaproteobacteria bacterium]|nr:hypothetical protein [Betaproteobacteria bacterium]